MRGSDVVDLSLKPPLVRVSKRRSGYCLHGMAQENVTQMFEQTPDVCFGDLRTTLNEL